MDDWSSPKSVPVSFESPLDALIDQPCRASWITIQFCSHKVGERSICWRSSFPAAGIKDKTSMSWKMSKPLIVLRDGVMHIKERGVVVMPRGDLCYALCNVQTKNSFNSCKGCWKWCSSATPCGKAPTIPHSIKTHIANTGDEGLPIDGDHKFQNLLRGSNHPSSGWVLPQHGCVFGEKMSA